MRRMDTTRGDRYGRSIQQHLMQFTLLIAMSWFERSLMAIGIYSHGTSNAEVVYLWTAWNYAVGNNERIAKKKST